MLTLKQNYTRQKSAAKIRGIEWKLTFEEWLSWWIDSGNLDNRGCTRGSYVMGRKGDKGAYELGNIICQTVEENNVLSKCIVKSGENHGRAKLNWEQVRIIRSDLISSKEMAGVFNVSPSLIKRIRRNEIWKEP